MGAGRNRDGRSGSLKHLTHAATHSESEFISHPKAHLYRSWDNMAVELEVAEFLHAWVRLTKPEVILETGAGRSSLFIAEALEANGQGHLHISEPEPEWRRWVTAHLADLPATVHATTPDIQPDLVFLDGPEATREADIHHWAKEPMTLIVHDAHRHKKALPKKGFLLDTPRGLWISPS